MAAEALVTVVVLTHQRSAELRRTLAHLRRLPERPAIVVVDSGSCTRDARANREAAAEVGALLVRVTRHLGAAARNAGVAQVRTPYVAFCDDDTWWAPGALQRAVEVMASCPSVGLINGQVRVGPEQRPDPRCTRMAQSPLDRIGLPGPAILSFVAGAVVMRTQAFKEAGGYEPRLFHGAEERLMGLDLATLGWDMVYVPDAVVHHHPAPPRQPGERRLLAVRNRLWIAAMRLPWPDAFREVRHILRQASAQGVGASVLWRAVTGLPWALWHRQRVPADVVRMHRLLRGDADPRHAVCPKGMPRVG